MSIYNNEKKKNKNMSDDTKKKQIYFLIFGWRCKWSEEDLAKASLVRSSDSSNCIPRSQKQQIVYMKIQWFTYFVVKWGGGES